MAAPVALTIAEAVTVLSPPLTERQLRGVIRAVGLQPCAWRHSGRGRGHPVGAYDAAVLMRLHAALRPFMAADVTAGS